ncbi:hypothetical protein M0804_014730 [Polistes exclamans]|nr:hypothetical protein M0804_014733 [Polistes exclamans]KAI4474668.1 hypothetical protein M0804_014730 [Polistes exclamans]
MVVLELEAVYAQAAPHTKLLNKRFVGAHHWLGPLKEALVARLAADKMLKEDPTDVMYLPQSTDGVTEALDCFENILKETAHDFFMQDSLPRVSIHL